MTYRDAGVDIDAGDSLVERIKPFARATRRPEVLEDVGGFAGMMRIPAGLEDPVMVSGTDGVGTKLKVAFAMNKHDTIGQDLVAMCANDVATCGAEPLFFLDYFGTGALDVNVAESVIKGIANGCKLAGCALLGGETAELPGMYAAGEYDLAGFCVGIVDRKKIVDGKKTSRGDAVVGVFSSGVHSNGYSLVRRALLEAGGHRFDEVLPGLTRPLGLELLEPTRIYARALRAAIGTGWVHGAAHITGGGLPGNVPRVLPDGLGVRVDPARWPRPAVFDLVQKAGNVDEHEMRRTFNLGLGLVVMCHVEHADDVVRAFEQSGERAARIGEVISSDADFEARVEFVGG
ncbi:MAG: phosphoribosylformylglycinamidine cyclo-ligase [Deltaproteobacteria bacterium]